MENTEQVQSQPIESQPPQEDFPITLTKKAVDMVKITREQEGIDPSARAPHRGARRRVQRLRIRPRLRERDAGQRLGLRAERPHDLRGRRERPRICRERTSTTSSARRARGSSSTTPRPAAPAAAARRSPYSCLEGRIASGRPSSCLEDDRKLNHRQVGMKRNESRRGNPPVFRYLGGLPGVTKGSSRTSAVPPSGRSSRVPGSAPRRWRMARPAGRPRAIDSTTVVTVPPRAPRKKRRSRSGCRFEDQTPEHLLDPATVVDAGDHLLAEIAPLGVADRASSAPVSWGKLSGAEVAAEAGDARLDAQDLQGLEADRPRPRPPPAAARPEGRRSRPRPRASRPPAPSRPAR